MLQEKRWKKLRKGCQVTSMLSIKWQIQYKKRKEIFRLSVIEKCWEFCNVHRIEVMLERPTLSVREINIKKVRIYIHIHICKLRIESYGI